MSTFDDGGRLPADLLRAGLSRRGFLRWTALAGGLAAVAPILAACGGDDDDESTPTAAAGTTPTSGGGATATSGGGAASPTSGGGAATATSGGGAATTPTTAAAEPSPTTETVEGSGGSIISVHANDADSLDPQRTVLGDSWVIFRSIYDTLVSKNPALEFEPLIAESWEVSDDGIEYTYKIRSGMTFHDGSDVTADDVKYTFDRAVDPDAPSQAASFIDAYDHAEMVDASTVKLILKEANAPFTSNIAVEYFGILPQAAVEAAGDDFGTNPIGSGPWKFKEWTQGEICTLEPFEDYKQFRTYVENKGAPLADELSFRVIPEAQTQIAALQTGEINHIQLLPTHEYANFKDDKDYVVLVPAGSSEIDSIEFATEAPTGELGDPVFRKPFDDLKVRQAVAYGVNADEIIDSVYEGLAQRAYGPMPTGLFAYDPAIEEFGFKFDQDKANSLLDEAGWTMGSDNVREKDGEKLEVTYWLWSDPTIEKAVQVIQNQLGQIGMKVTLQTMDIGTMVAQLPTDTSYQFNFMGVGWPEADILYIVSSFQWGAGRYHRKEYMDLITQARQETDQGKRKELYFEAQKIFMEDLPWVPLWSPLVPTAVRAEVKNFKLGADATFIWEDVFVES